MACTVEAQEAVTVHTWGNSAWEREHPALIASARAKCPRSQEKCEHVPLHHILTSDLSRATIARAKETKHNTRAHDGYLTRRGQHDSY